MRRAIGGAVLAAMTGCAGAALAHPHVFIDARIEVIFDADGRAEALRIDWTYDELFSLLLIEEQGLDPDMDGVLTEAEMADLSGFDMEWAEDFPGDTYALLQDRPIGLSRPVEWTAQYAGGRITSSHLRRFEPAALVRGELVVQVYDPSYYTAYILTGPVSLTGTLPGPCEAVIWEPDREAADARLAAAMEEFAGEDADFPAIGEAYAEEVRISCNAS
jgi:ABC-type uncharacterized transport system substrate-binding protein